MKKELLQLILGHKKARREALSAIENERQKTSIVPSPALQEKINYFYEPYGVAQHMSFCMEFSKDSEEIKKHLDEGQLEKLGLQWPKNDLYKGWRRLSEFMFESDMRSYFYFLQQCQRALGYEAQAGGRRKSPDSQSKKKKKNSTRTVMFANLPRSKSPQTRPNPKKD